MAKKTSGQTTGRDARALAHVQAFKASLRTTRDSMKLRLEEFHDIYRGIWREDKHSYSGRSRLFLKEAMKGIDTLVANLIAALLPDPPFRFAGRERQDEDTAARNEALVVWQFDRTGVSERLEELVETAAWSGFCIGKVSYRKIERTVKGLGEVESPVLDDDGNPIFDDTGNALVRTDTESVERDITDYSGPVLDTVDLFNAWFDPRVKDIQRGPGIAEEYDLTLEEIRALERQEVFRNVADLARLSSENVESRLEESTGVTEPSDFQDHSVYRITEFWGPFDWSDNGKRVECIIVIANDSVVLRVDRNPYWHGKRPYVMARMKESGDALGIGFSEVVSADLYAANDLTNQRIDNVTLVLNKMWKYKRGSVYPHDLYTSPGHAIGWRDNSTDIEPIFTPDVTTSSYKETEIARQDIREVIGATNPVQGIPSTNKTATEIHRLAVAANRKFLRYVKRFERSLVKPVAEMFYQINQQTLDKTIPIRLGIGDIELIEPEQIRGDYDVLPLASTELMTEADAAKLIQFMQVLGTTGGATRWDLAAIEERIGKALGIRDIDKLRAQAAPRLTAIEGGIAGASAGVIGQIPAAG